MTDPMEWEEQRRLGLLDEFLKDALRSVKEVVVKC